jgi:hypothetical protein
MFTEDFFKKHQSFYSQSPQKEEDLLLRLLLRLHIASNYTDDRDFKINAVHWLRNSTVYKVTKLIPEIVEDNLINCFLLSPTSFCALAVLFHINIILVLGNMYVVVGSAAPTHYVAINNQKNTNYSIQVVPSSNFEELLRIHLVGKPLNALSYYTAADLEAMTSKLRVKKGSKHFMYNGINSYVQKKLTALSS